MDLLAEFGKTLILEIDPPMDAIACRRKMFYERCVLLCKKIEKTLILK